MDIKYELGVTIGAVVIFFMAVGVYDVTSYLFHLAFGGI